MSHAAVASVFINAHLASAATEPASFAPNQGPGPYIETTDYVEQIHWSSWGAAQATGSAQVQLLTDATSTSPATVTLGGLSSCGGQLVYTTYTLALAPGAASPKLWPQGQSGSFPCHITAAAYNGVERLSRADAARGHCVLNDGLEVLLPTSPPIAPRWTPKTPPHGNLSPGMCAMLWTSWGKPLAVGRGVMRDGSAQWPAKVELSALAWCPREGIAYSTLAMTLYGHGEAITGMGSVSKHDAARLRGEIGRRGLGAATYRQTRADCTLAG
jgi:hypothetical protein